MLNINAEQWTKLETQRRDGFLQQLTADLITRFVKPGEAVEFDKVKAELARVMEVGERWGMRSSQALYQHALASRIIGHDYADVAPQTGSVVKSSALDDSTKARWLKLWLASIKHRPSGAR